MPSNAKNEKFTRDHLFNCQGLVALVTGGGSGAGLMITQTLVANGAKVYITERTASKLERVAELYSEGVDSIIPIASDITRKEDIQKLVDTISTREPRGVARARQQRGDQRRGSPHDTGASGAEEAKAHLFDAAASTFEDWVSVYRTNVPPLFFMTTAFPPLLEKSNDNSNAATRGLRQCLEQQRRDQRDVCIGLACELTAAASVSVSASISGDGLRARVRVNALAPGLFPSEMTAGESAADRKSVLDMARYDDRIPAKRAGCDEDMAQAVLRLVCSQYMNGETLVVDGGYALAMGK